MRTTAEGAAAFLSEITTVSAGGTEIVSSGGSASGTVVSGVLVYAGCRLLLLPLGMVTKLRTGLQENFVNSAWDAAGICLSVGLFYMRRVGFGSGIAIAGLT